MSVIHLFILLKNAISWQKSLQGESYFFLKDITKNIFHRHITQIAAVSAIYHRYSRGAMVSRCGLRSSLAGRHAGMSLTVKKPRGLTSVKILFFEKVDFR